MNHGEIQRLLADYRDLRGEERRAVDAHIATCPACAARLTEYQAMDVALQGLRDARPAPALRVRYFAAIESKALRHVPPAAARRKWLYGFASVAALLLVAAAAWALLRPAGRNVGRLQGMGGIVTASPSTAPTPAGTAQLVVVPTAVTTPDPALVLQPSWQQFEQALSQTVLGTQLANPVCDWKVLEREGNSIAVWAYCTAYQGAPGATAVSLPAMMNISGDGSTVTVQKTRDGTYYAEDVRALFGPAVQQMIFNRTFDADLPQLEQHAKLRLKWPMLPPLGASDTGPTDAGAQATQATVSIFSGRPDPTWMITEGELNQLDGLIRGLPKGQCPPLPDQLGYRGVQVQLGEGNAGRLIAVNGFVQSGDAGMASDAICLSDPKRAVESFLLRNAEANIEDQGVKDLLVQLQQPVPAPTSGPTLPPGWTQDGDGSLGIHFGRPVGWEVGTKTERSRVYQSKPESPTGGLAEPSPFWFTVLPPGFTNDDWSAYNFWQADLVARAWDTLVGQGFVSDHAPEGYNTYTRLPDTTVDGFAAAVVNNATVWEMPKDTQERRVLVKVGGMTVMFGTYYRTDADLQTFEQVLASVKFDGMMLTSGAASMTPTPTDKQ